MLTVHLIFNAHLDPVWLWPWHNGLDALLATCRSACDRLDAHPELHFSKGEAWGYDQIERVAPRLFERIQGHIAAGRWHPVGGWWIQPDCNGPSGFAMERQIELGQRYFRERLGGAARTAFNPDSFGHSAALPDLLAAGGQDRYVMMRPQEHEMTLPARVFRWRGREGGAEVVVFRIAGGYAIRDMTVEHVRAALQDLPAGIEHTLCFVGLGDHGGGPTERQIEWCRRHAESIPGCRLVFSWPDAFFDAIWPQRESLPLVTGELQQHAVGCYSVSRSIKVRVKRAEHALQMAEGASRGAAAADDAARIDAAWRQVCFHHFHDICAGTCIPSTFPIAHGQLDTAFAAADEIAHHALRRRMEALPDDPLQRVCICNLTGRQFEGFVEHEAWFERRALAEHWRLIDEAGAPVPVQVLRAEGTIQWDATYFVRMRIRAALDPGELRVLRIQELDSAAAAQASPIVASRRSLIGDRAGLSLDDDTMTLGGGPPLPLPELELITDDSDTWSHGLDRFAGKVVATADWCPAEPVDHGPLMASLVQPGRIDDSTLTRELRIHAGVPAVDLLLTVHWRQQHRLLKLTWALPAEIAERVDGIMAGGLRREPDGAERPIRDYTLLTLVDGRRIGIVCPDVFALDATPRRVRFTLLRAPLLAHHDPAPADHPRGVFADQGVHTFRFRFCGGPSVNVDDLESAALRWLQPPLTADLTRGMAL